MQDVVTTRSSLPGTGPFEEPTFNLHRDNDRETHHPEGLAAIVGSATLALSAAALVAYAVRERSWRSAVVAVAGAPLVYRGATGRWPVSRAMAHRLSGRAEPAPIETSVTIGRPAAELYESWRRLENLPRFMRHLESVREMADGRSHWVARTPTGERVQWDAEIVEERPGRLLSWRSLPGSAVETAGSVLFEEAPGGRGTLVRVVMEVGPGSETGGTGGMGGVVQTLTSLFSGIGGMAGKAAEMQVREDLRRFKELMEAGEIPTTDGQPHGERGAIDIKNPL